MHCTLPARAAFGRTFHLARRISASRPHTHTVVERGPQVSLGMATDQPASMRANPQTPEWTKGPEPGLEDEFKKHHADAWSKGAESYHNQAHQGAGVLKPLAQHMADLAVKHVQTLNSSQALDVASGCGEPALTIAKLAPTCHVVATDLAPGMIPVANRRGEGVANFRAEVADAEDLGNFADGTFDVVTCSAGLMMVPDHHKALREWHRVLKSGGYMAAAVWAQPGPQTQMIGVMRAVVQKLATGVQMQGNPNQLGDSEQLAKDVAAAGFQNVELSEFNVPMELPAEHLREAMLQNPMMASHLDQAKAQGRQNIYEEALAAVKEVAAEQGRQRDDGGLSLPINMAIIVTATA